MTEKERRQGYMSGCIIIWWEKPDMTEGEANNFLRPFGLEIIVFWKNINGALVKVPIGEENVWVERLKKEKGIVRRARLNYCRGRP